MKLSNQRTWAEINLDNFKNNIEVIRKHTEKTAKLMAVIKADGYGHGAVTLAKEAEKSGFEYFAVACIDEVKELRRSAVKLPIVILSYTSYEDAEDIIKYDAIPAVFNKELPEKLNEAARKAGKKIKVHIKLNTGMTRLGFDTERLEETVNDIVYISKLDNIEVDGIFTHFADADNEDSEFVFDQYERFDKVLKELSKKGICIPNRHICNSAATIANKDMQLDMVRCGIMLYGYYPEKYLEEMMPGIKPVMEIKSKILQIREIEKNVTVGYGRTYKSEKKLKIGVVPIGYADGYSRLLSNDFYLLVCGKKARILGRVCMDQLMIDITDIDDAYEGCEVTVMGKDGDLSLTADDIAAKLGTISYEILCDIGRRVPRVYIKDNKFDSKVNYLE